jgi:GTP cyclohydrolase II
MTTITSSHLATGRAVDQLRRQLGIIFQEVDGKSIGACPIEGVTGELLSTLMKLPGCHRSLLITGARARSLGIKTKDGRGVKIDAQALPFTDLLAIADPLAQKKNMAPLTTSPATPSHDMLLTLARYASLLPAMLIVEGKDLPSDWLHVNEADVRAYWDAPPLDMIPLTQAAMPVEGAEDTKVICFRQRYGTAIHLALVVGELGDNPLTRIHSSCITGDILGSLRCDCGDQLKLALDAIKKQGGGLLLYLHQEGRGIGIANKLRAYQLQEQGIDTYEANRMLGFEVDERDFSIAVAMLKKLGISRIRMLTNNPQKMTAIEKAGIKVSDRIPLIAPTGKHNHGYLEAKGKAGHLF